MVCFVTLICWIAWPSLWTTGARTLKNQILKHKSTCATLLTYGGRWQFFFLFFICHLFYTGINLSQLLLNLEIYLESLLHTTSVILTTTLITIQASHLLYVFLFLLISMKNFQKCLVDVRLSLESVLKSWQNWINNVFFFCWLAKATCILNEYKKINKAQGFFTLILLT